MQSKQVIIVRTDLEMPVGKVASQVAHASMLAVLKLMQRKTVEHRGELKFIERTLRIHPNTPMMDWLEGKFTKVVLGVPTEDEMMTLFVEAKKTNLPVSVIKDEGRTCFNHVPTYTCIAIGPGEVGDIDSISGHLKLLK